MRIRVLEVLASLRRAGAETVAVTLATRLDPERFHTGVVSLYDAFPNGFEPDLDRAGVPVYHLGKRPGLDWRMLPRLGSVFRGFQPHLIHTHSYVLRYAWPAAWRLAPPCMVHTVHNIAQREVDRLGRLLHRVVFRWPGRRRALAVAIGEAVARSFHSLYGFPPAAVIPNGIDINFFRQPLQRDTWRSSHGFQPQDLLFTSVARLDPQKDPLTLIEGFAAAHPERRNAYLLIAGEGSLLETARARAAALGIAERVRFLGLRQDIPELLAASDAFLLASRWEGNPLSVIEAMAASLPVVATAVGGVPELLAGGRAGILIAPGDVTALAHAITELASGARRQSLGHAAALRAKQYDSSRMVDSYARLFQQIAGARA